MASFYYITAFLYGPETPIWPTANPLTAHGPETSNMANFGFFGRGDGQLATLGRKKSPRKPVASC